MSKRSTWVPIVAGVGSLAILVVAVVAYTRLTRVVPIAEEPVASEEKQEEKTAQEMVPLGSDQRCTLPYYQQTLVQDAARYGIVQTSVEMLQQPLKGGVEWSGEFVFSKKKKSLVTPHLVLTTAKQKIYPDPKSGLAARADHLVLNIKNRTSAPLGYRVNTQVRGSAECGKKGNIPHNALALLPLQEISRSECLYGPADQTLTVTSVEVYELTELGHRYLSRIEPVEGAAFDMRVSGGHDFGGLPPCHLGNGRDLPTGADAWHTLVDFYARHNCEEYGMVASYQPFKKAEKLPSCEPSPPPEVAAGPVVIPRFRPRHTEADAAYAAGQHVGTALLFFLLVALVLKRVWPKKKAAPQKAAAVLEMNAVAEDQLRH